MGGNSEIPPQLDLNAKWDACLDLALRRFAYSSLAGAFGGLLLFNKNEVLGPAKTPFGRIYRSPVTRWASVAFGAGVGIGSAYTECSYKFGGSPAKLAAPTISDNPNAPVEQD